MDSDRPALLTIAHGTRDPRGAQEMAVLVERLRSLLGVPVANGWIEDFSEPDPAGAAATLVEQGASAIVTLPLLVFGAGHAKTDVPEGVAEVRAALPGIRVLHGGVLGLQRSLFDLAARRVAGARRAAGLESAPGESEVLVVTGAGSSDPDANGDLAKAGRYLAEATGHRWVDTAYAGVTWPRADVALRRAGAAGARLAVLFSWSLLAGLLEARVSGMAAEVSDATGLQIVDAGRFGPAEEVAAAVANRYHEALHGHASANCDLCQYRLPFPGREQRAGAPSAGGTGSLLTPAARAVQESR